MKIGKSLVLTGLLSVLAVSALSPSIAHAAITVSVNDGGIIEADVSLQHPTRIYFKYDSGDQLIFNQPEGSTPEVTAVVDGKGDVYLSVLEGHPGQKIAGFLTTEAGRTYVIKLTIKAQDVDQIEVVSSEAKKEIDDAKAAEAAPKDVSKPFVWDRAASYEQDVSMIMKALYWRARPEGFDKVRPATGVILSEEMSIAPERVYKASNVLAASFVVTNNSEYLLNPETLIEKIGPYIAVAFTTDNLHPGASCYGYIIRKSDVPSSFSLVKKSRLGIKGL